MEDSKAAAEALKEEYDRISEAVRLLDEKITETQNAENEAKLSAGNLEGQIDVIKEQIRTEELNAEHIKTGRLPSMRSWRPKRKNRDRSGRRERLSGPGSGKCQNDFPMRRTP